MELLLNEEKLHHILTCFEQVSGLCATVFDARGEIIISGLTGTQGFCHLLQSKPSILSKCMASNRRAFQKTALEQTVYVYRCHVGISEMAAPVFENRQLIAFVMAGQFLQEESPAEDWERTRADCARFLSPPEMERLRGLYDTLPRLSGQKIRAWSELLKACTSYIFLSESLRLYKDETFETIDRYIENHLQEDLTAEALVRYLGVSRNALYQSVRRNRDMSLGQYVRLRRLDQAKQLLRDTKLPIAEIAQKVGIADFNYFTKLFKGEFRQTPRSYRKQFECRGNSPDGGTLEYSCGNWGRRG